MLKGISASTALGNLRKNLRSIHKGHRAESRCPILIIFNLMKNTLVMDLVHTALRAAVEASEAIMEIYLQDFEAQWKEDGSPVTIADLRSNDILVGHLESTGIHVISEESEKEAFSSRKDYELVWCVDPLDGTKEFLKKNGEFAVCIALIQDQKPVLGIIASPVERKLIIGGQVIPAAHVDFKDVDDASKWRYIEKRESLNSPLVIAGSRSHLSGNDLNFTNEMKSRFGEVIFLQKGSALKFIDLALGKADVYPRFAPTMEWDIAAGQAIIESLGGTVVQADTNESLRYNKENLYNPYFVVYTAPMLS